MSNEEIREKFIDIAGYEGYYQVSNLGRIKSLKRTTRNGKCEADKILVNTVANKGYLAVGLKKNGKSKNYLVHRIVASSFISNPQNKPQVNHKNGDKSDNRVDNLEWATQSENIRHGLDMGLYNCKSRAGAHSKLNLDDVMAIMALKGKMKLKETGNKFGISDRHVWAIQNGKRWDYFTTKLNELRKEGLV